MTDYPPHLLGEQAEQLAQKVLASHGLKLIEKNFRCKVGEIDLILLDQDCIVFTEVRARTSKQVMHPFESIDVYKQQKIVCAAEFFLLKNPRYADYLCRFDAIAIDFSQAKPSLSWIKDAFRPD